MVAGGRVETGDFYRDLISGHELVIAADSGADAVRALGLTPDLIVGDLDSISPDTLAWARVNKVAIREFPADKDKTDTELALAEAINFGASDITLTGAWGGRPDHALANVFLLRSARRQAVTCCIREEVGEIHLVDDRLVVDGAPGDIVSLLALEDCAGVALGGFKYKVPSGRLVSGSTLGVSNILLGEQGTIGLQSGLLLVVFSRDIHGRPIDSKGVS